MHADDKIVDRLAKHAAFSPIGRGDLERLVRTGVKRSLDPGDTLAREGESADRVYLILSGAVDVERAIDSGESYRLRRFGPNDTIGFSLVAGAPASATVVAAEPTVVLAVRGSELRDIYSRHPEAALAAIRVLAEMIDRLTSELEEASRGSVVWRVRRRLLRLAGNRREVEITHRDLATQVGAERASVSRALAELEGEGFLRRHRGRIEIL